MLNAERRAKFTFGASLAVAAAVVFFVHQSQDEERDRMKASTRGLLSEEELVERKMRKEQNLREQIEQIELRKQLEAQLEAEMSVSNTQNVRGA
eukprot:CFRG3272T1